MAVTLKTRKPIVTIRADDLDAFPIWEFCIDEEDVEGMDETWIRPVNARQLENDAYGLTVAAEFATANGLRLNGLWVSIQLTALKLLDSASRLPITCG